MSEVQIRGHEIKKIKSSLDAIIDTIAAEWESSFPKYANNLFYENGRSKELLERVLSNDSPADYSGKILMLVSYYRLLSSYVDASLEAFEEQDAQMKKRFSGSTRIEEQ